jgi:hypothetical protein
MQEVDSSIFKHLRDSIKGGFDEERFSGRVGFGNLKKCAPRAFLDPLSPSRAPVAAARS